MVLKTVLFYLLINLAFALFSWLVAKRNFLMRYRIQDKDYEPGAVFQRFPLALLNIALISTLIGVSLWYFSDYVEQGEWSLIEALIQAAVVFFVGDLWFYFLHRLMHRNTFLLKKVHAKHHMRQPFALDAMYLTQWEWMLAGIPNFIVLAILAPFHIYTLWLILAIQLLVINYAHCGLRIPLLSSIPFLADSVFHDGHHTKPKSNFASTFTIWDTVFGTKST